MTVIGCLSGCGKAAKSRGNCQAHYLELREAVKLGKTTWTRLEQQGKAKPPQGKQKFNDGFWRLMLKRRNTRQT